MQKRTKAATESFILILVIAGILIALNALSALGGYKRVDLTKTQRYTLSTGSGNLLKSMKQKMTVEAYVTKGVPKLDAFVRDLRDLLVEYRNSSNGNFDFTLVEAKDEATKKKAEEAHLQEIPFVQESDTESTAAVAKGYMGLVLHYGELQDVVEYLPPDPSNPLEFWITNKIREMRDKGDNIAHKIGVISGKDELKVSDNLLPSSAGQKVSLQQIMQSRFKFYDIQEVDLKGGEGPIDDKLDGLIITQPNKEYTEAELRRIDEFVLKGKSLAIFAGAVNVPASNASMSVTLNTWGLEKLLDGYGIEMRKDAVLEFKAPLVLPLRTESGIGRVWSNAVIHLSDDSRYTGSEQLLDTSFVPFFRQPELPAPMTSSLVLHPEKQPGATLKVVARSTERAVRRTEGGFDVTPLKRILPKGDPGQYAVAAALEFDPGGGKKLKSAFPGGDRKGVPEESDKPARILVFASSQFLANPFARAGNAPDMGGNPMMQHMPGGEGDKDLQQLGQAYIQSVATVIILVFKNTLDWLSGETDLIATSAKIVAEPNLVYDDSTVKELDANASEDELKKRDSELRQTRRTRQIWVSWGLILGVPFLVALYGVLRWRLRIAARSHASLA